MLHAEAVRDLPYFVCKIIVHHGSRREGQVEYAGQKLLIEHSQVASELRESDALPGVHLVPCVDRILAFRFAQQGKLPLDLVDGRRSQVAGAKFFVLLLVDTEFRW